MTATPSPEALADDVRHDARRFAALTRTFSDFVWIADAEGNLVSDMPPWRAVTGQSAEELLGRGWLAAVHPADRGRVEAAWARATATREAYDIEYRIVGPEDERWFEVRAAPVLDDDGALVEWIGTAADVTDRRAAELRTEALAEAVDHERGVLEQVIAQTPSAIALLTGPEHRYRLYNEAYTALVPPGRLAPGLTVAQAFPEAVAAAVPLLDRAYRGEEVMLDPLKVPFAGPGSFQGHRYYRGYCRPLLQGGEPVGVVVTALETTEDVRQRHSLQAKLAAERRIAERMQRALLPDRLPVVRGLELAQRYVTAGEDVSVGGDWYDVLPLHDGRVLVSLGDISGRGLAAASEMSQVRAAIRAYADEGAAPSEILRRVASLVETVGLADMITAGVGLLDASSGRLVYANAAHLPPLLLPAAGGARYAPAPSNVPLGLGGRDGDFRAVELRMGPGDALVLFTDGLVEQRGRSLADTLELLRDHAARAPGGASAQELADHLGGFVGEHAGADDAALLVVRRAVR